MRYLLLLLLVFECSGCVIGSVMRTSSCYRRYERQHKEEIAAVKAQDERHAECLHSVRLPGNHHPYYRPEDIAMCSREVPEGDWSAIFKDRDCPDSGVVPKRRAPQ